jgi:chromosome segregation protein
MHLKSMSMKGFKSFPERTDLAFAPGVSVIVGPNGCGKSNVTDAVLWALGEQSPTAVRGNSMQDVIFAGGKGSGPRRFAEVEVVIDNADGRSDSEFSEIAIKRRIDRSGEGEYRLNGARARLADVIDTLAETGLGQEMHSVISQGRVEQIVSSKPRDRRILIEEAAGLGKHRKRRRRAQLKLERTQENIDRAIDVEREARSRLRPLKRQAEAAERGAKIQREDDELRAELLASEAGAAGRRLEAAEKTVADSKQAREVLDDQVAEIAKRRRLIEEKIATGDRERREAGERLVEARTALERIGLRRNAITSQMVQLRAGLGERQLQLEQMGEPEDDGAAARIQRLETELSELAGARAAEETKVALAARDAARVESDKAMSRRAQLAGELSAVEAQLAAALAEEGEDSLAALLQVAPGVEQALSAALGDRLRAAVVESLNEGAERLGAIEGAGRALIARHGDVPPAGDPPVEGARRLLDMIEADGPAKDAADRLLADAWLVDSLGSLPDGFRGIAVTLDGKCFDGAAGELRKLPRTGTDPALIARSQREELVLRLEKRTETEARARRELEIAEERYSEARAAQDAAEASPEAVRRAQLEAELAAERRHHEAALQAAEARRAEGTRLERRIQVERDLLPSMERLSEALEVLDTSLRERVERLQSGAGEGGEGGIAAELRKCSQEEFELQTQLRDASERLTVSEVEASQLRERRREMDTELTAIAGRLERKIEPAAEPMADERREEIEAKLERLVRRREQIGPVNPLAESEYAEAKEHVDVLAEQRKDMEKALRELQGLIRQTDKEISAAFEETFEATAKNFEEMVQELFPGGSGKLTKVEEKPSKEPKASAGAPGIPGSEAEEMPEDGEAEDLEDEGPRPEDHGVEISVTPAGKSQRRLSLMSGGEKSMVALAFVFAVLLAKPCPFYILDEVEAALDDINLDRFLRVVRRFADRSQFIIVTHQKRTMDAADALYGISMGDDGITKVVSRRLPRDEMAERRSDPGEGGMEPPLAEVESA